jgi:hypothetical protein
LASVRAVMARSFLPVTFVMIAANATSSAAMHCSWVRLFARNSSMTSQVRRSYSFTLTI